MGCEFRILFCRNHYKIILTVNVQSHSCKLCPGLQFVINVEEFSLEVAESSATKVIKGLGKNYEGILRNWD